jgi:hypothetical protein
MSNPTKIRSSAATERILSVTKHLKNSLNPPDDIHKAKMSLSYKFQGWMGLDKESAKGKLVWQEYEPKTWTEDDVDIKITHCGICGSDLHTLRSGWVPLLFFMQLKTNPKLIIPRAQHYTPAALGTK